MMDWLKKGSGYKLLLSVCVVVTVLGILVLGYLCSEQVCAFNRWSYSQSRYHTWNKLSLKHISDNMGKPISFLSNPLHSLPRNKLSYDDMVKEDFEFDIKGSDVIVFLHIQKTGGTAFGRHLVRDLDLEQPCQCKKGRKKCKCYRPDSEDRFWLFSRYSTGWKCGLHADWTELTNCVDSAMDQTERESSKRRYFYITLLREPVARFLSEYRHVQRGATWKTAKHLCGGRVPTPEELPLCFTGEDWTGVTLEEFIQCSSNLAINRQTRMLADLTLVGCYNTSIMSRHERDIIMLTSAKQNLKKMAFFGLCEFQKISQYLFESTFHLHFLQSFEQLNETHSSLTMNEISSEDLNKIRKLNYLDVQLYEFAKELLMQRFEYMRKTESNFEEVFENLGKKRNQIETLFKTGLDES
ncbi:heparan-sulfate 6-O-sulfotransferase 2-like [Centruroides sculpturatus]|uniref:heparan-sulfate 6-O-sulfotransferase 2-like n=1 Tax=Centruroides sculpturatus TaxID=218467 RepID=UPI000C6D2E58|nr:heparan-sulfate 6-O-sulfotransferase 2-like [Centruroides sculpturatus]XP_023243310.1 heparan-sulfate 6-O-sulfotransferase 2-like [Centruroides sculpturatus]